MSAKLYIKTFGCQMNEYDSDKMADVLRESHGLTRAATPEEADVLLLNTCSIREKAQEKVFSLLGRWRALKESDDRVVIGVGGCVASQEGDAIAERAPFVDIVFGPQTLHRLPQLLDEVRGGAWAASPAPRRANASKKRTKSVGSLANAAASSASRASIIVGALGVSFSPTTR